MDVNIAQQEAATEQSAIYVVLFIQKEKRNLYVKKLKNLI